MISKKASFVSLLALALVVCLVGRSEAGPIIDVVAYKAGDVYTFDSTRWQDVLVGVKVSTNPYAWGLPSNYATQHGFDAVVGYGGAFGWMAQPQGTTQQNLVSSNTWIRPAGAPFPNEVFLWSTYSVFTDGDFVMTGPLDATFSLTLWEQEPTPPSDRTNLYEWGKYLAEMADYSEPKVATWVSQSSSLSIEINGIVVTAQDQAGPGFPGSGTGNYVLGGLPRLALPDNLASLSSVEGLTFTSSTTSIQPVPEPASLPLLGAGLVALVGTARRRIRQ